MPKKLDLPKMDYVLLGLVLTLLAFGLLALSSASSVLSFERFGNNHFYVLRQITFGAIPGLILLYFFSRINYHVWQKFAPLLVLIGMVLLVLVLIPGIGFAVGGARRWIDFGYFLFQPAEFVKLAIIFYLASWYDKRKLNANDLYYGFLPTLFIVGIISGLIILEPDLGTMVGLALIAATMFFVGGAKIKHLFSTALASLLVLWLLIKAAPYRLERIVAYFNPQVDQQGISYQINQALLAIGSGGLWGTGFGQSRQKFNYLPETIGDSIFAIMSEELGFVRMTILLLILLFFAFRGYKIAKNAPDVFGKLVAAGITSWLVFQSLMNIGGITAIIPLAGIPLPFISYGSSALAISLASIGVLLNISRFSE
ncbi:MAG: putative lipid II flippase FtsW [Candidatus Doudnabacteria bacterium]|nr:putative lipid II flippase FtsW [Candidatus Doudnabacteria bacterium]